MHVRVHIRECQVVFFSNYKSISDRAMQLKDNY